MSLFLWKCILYSSLVIHRHTGGAVPLRFLVKTAIAVVTPPVDFDSFPPTAVEPPCDRRSVASLLFRDCKADVLRRRVGDGGATAVICTVPRRSRRCRCDHTADWPNRGGTAEVLNMFKVSTVPSRRSAVLAVFRCATAINDGTTAEPRRSWRCHCGLCRTNTAVAPRLRCDGVVLGGTAEHVQSFHRALAKVRGFGSFSLCYGDQWRNHCGTTAIMAVSLRFMPYKHRSGTAPPSFTTTEVASGARVIFVPHAMIKLGFNIRGKRKRHALCVIRKKWKSM